MTKFQLLSVMVGLTLVDASLQAGPPHASWSVGVNLGGPGPYYRPYHYHPYPVYRPYYYAPATVYVEPAPIYVRPAPIVVQAPQPVVSASPQYIETAQPANYQTQTNGAAEAHLANLRSPDETTRRNSVLELGRMKAIQALEPLTATLAGDQSPSVREAAARSLGLLGSSRALTALLHAAQADPDRDVRHTSQFAVDIIRVNGR